MILFALLSTVTLAQVRAAPNEVRNFIERRESCNHWAGEEPYDKDRAGEIASAQRRLRCDKVANDGAALQRRFRKSPDIVELLTATADWIE